MNDNDVQIIQPPNTLLARVGETGGPSIDGIVAEAEAKLTDVQTNFETWLRANLKRLEEARGVAGAAKMLPVVTPVVTPKT